jgi:hypothetical protein
MAFTVPDFNLSCNIFTGPWIGKVFRLSADCNLAQGKRSMPVFVFENNAPQNYTTSSQLLLPAGTDIRDASPGGEPDIVEVPAGSGRWYSCVTVDDFGKGFDNEHRFAILHKIWEQLNPVLFPGANWPAPIP